MTCASFTSVFPTFEFLIDNEKFTVPPQAYLLDYRTDNYYYGEINACYPAVSYYSSTDTILAGLPFTANFVPTFNYDKNTVKFALSAKAVSSTKFTTSMSDGTLIGIIVGSVVGLAIIAFIICRCMKKSKHDRAVAATDATATTNPPGMTYATGPTNAAGPAYATG